jgi:predicted nucleic-acid-binding protein
MLAVDANVLIRLIVGDDIVQSPRALALFEENEVWIATTVLLETEWVLRRVYRYGREPLARAIGSIAGLPNVQLEHPERIAAALARLQAGADFADALHVAGSGGAVHFATFDKACLRAETPGATPVRLI